MLAEDYTLPIRISGEPLTSLLVMTSIPQRVIETLQDFLPDELDLVDSEANTLLVDTFVTPDIPDENYIETDARLVTAFPGLTIRTASSEPIEVRSILFGSRIDAKHHVEIMVHVCPQQGDAVALQKCVHRYAAAILRVLTVEKIGLETLTSPTQYAEIVEWTAPLSFSPLPQQNEGSVVRTVTIPLSIRLRESRSA